MKYQVRLIFLLLFFSLPVFAQGTSTGGGAASNATSIQGIAVSTTPPTLNQCLTYNGTVWIPGSCGSGGSAFNSITSGTNTTAAMLVGTGGSLGTTGSGTIQATSNTGNSATATALASTPMNCGAGVAAIGILASGNATGCFTPAGPAGSTDAFQYNAGGGAFGGVNSPTTNGQYPCEFSVTASAAVAPTCPQAGLAGRAIVGSTTTDTTLYSDNLTVVTHTHAATGTLAITLPTPTTLLNTTFGYSYCNDSPQTDTITPTTWTIQAGNAAAGATLSIAPGNCYRIHVDPTAAATNWLADLAGTLGTVTSVTGTAPIVSSGGATPAISCATCVTSSGGGAITGTAPVSVSAAGVVSITGVAGQVLAGSGPAFTATPTLGVASTTTGTLAFANSGNTGVMTISPASGTVAATLTLPDTASGTFCVGGNSCTSPTFVTPVLGTPSSGTLTNATGLPINGVVSATGAIATIANGNNPLVLNCATTTASQACVTFGETTGATNATDVELQLTTIATSLAIPLKISQGTAASNSNASSAFTLSGGTGGAASPATTGSGKQGGSTTWTGGTGSAGGSTSGTGGAGGDFNFTTGTGGAATAGSTTGRGGNFAVTLGAAGGTGTPGAAGQFVLTGGTFAYGADLLMSSVMPTVSTGFGTGPTITGSSTASFAINVGTSTITNPGVLTMPAAAHGWSITCADVTSATSSTLFMTKQTASTTTSVTITQFTDTGTTGTPWTASDILECSAFAN